MKRQHLILISSVLLLWGSLDVHAASEEKEAEKEKQPMFVVPQPPVPEQRRAPWAATLDFRHWPASTFHRDYKENIVLLGAAHGAEKESVLLDLSELYLTHMLVDEAISVLDEILPQTTSQNRRHVALTHAAKLMDGQPVDAFEASPLLDPDRPDQAFWRTLQAIIIGDVQMLNENIEPSFRALQHQSRAMLEDMLPLFTEAAIETDHLDHADGAIQLIEEIPRYKDTATRYFLRGTEALRRGNDSTALDAYMIAAQGWDRYAARARLNIADMAMENGSIGALLAAQAVLNKGKEHWRGGQLELQVLRKHAMVNIELGDVTEGLSSLGKIITRFPQTGERLQAEEQAADLIEEVYTRGENSEISLSEWMNFHLTIAPIFAGLEGFGQYPERLADTVVTLGATDLAVREYQRSKAILLDHAGDTNIDDDLFRLNLKLAKAQYRAGLFMDAKETLANMSEPPDEDMQQAYLMLKADVLAESGDTEAFLSATLPSPTIEQMRKRIRVLVDEAQWPQAKNDLHTLWKLHPEAFGIEEATYLLIAGKKTSDETVIARVVNAFPSLTDSEDLIKLAEALSVDTKEPAPLRADDTIRRLEKLEEVFEKIRRAGITP